MDMAEVDPSVEASSFLLLHRHHLAGLCPRKKIQRLKRLCRSSAIRVVIMRFCVEIKGREELHETQSG
jgi:uncharacterized protein YpbB